MPPYPFVANKFSSSSQSSPRSNKHPKPRRTLTMPNPSTSNSSPDASPPATRAKSVHRPGLVPSSGGGGATSSSGGTLSNVFRNLTGRNRSASGVGQAQLGISNIHAEQSSRAGTSSGGEDSASAVTTPTTAGNEQAEQPLSIAAIVRSLRASQPPAQETAGYLSSLLSLLSSSPPPELPPLNDLLTVLDPYIWPPSPAETRTAALKCLAAFLSLTLARGLGPGRLTVLERTQIYAQLTALPPVVPITPVTGDTVHVCLEDVSARLAVLRLLLQKAERMPFLQGVSTPLEMLSDWAERVSAIRNSLIEPSLGEPSSEISEASSLLSSLLSLLTALPLPTTAERATALHVLAKLIGSATSADLARLRALREKEEDDVITPITFQQPSKRRASAGATVMQTPVAPKQTQHAYSPSVPPTRRPSIPSTSETPPVPPCQPMPLHSLPLSHLLPLLPGAPNIADILPHILPLFTFPPSPHPLPPLSSALEDTASLGEEGQLWQALRTVLLSMQGIRTFRLIREAVARGEPGAFRALRLGLRHSGSDRLCRVLLADAVASGTSFTGGGGVATDDEWLVERLGGPLAVGEGSGLGGASWMEVRDDVAAGLSLRRPGEGVEYADVDMDYEVRLAESLGMIKDRVEEGGTWGARGEKARIVFTFAVEWILKRSLQGESFILDLDMPVQTTDHPIVGNLSSLLSLLLPITWPGTPASTTGSNPMLPALLPKLLPLMNHLSPRAGCAVMTHIEHLYLLLPISPEWEANIEAVKDLVWGLQAGAVGSLDTHSPRQQAARLLLQTTFHALLDLPEYLAKLLDGLLPLVGTTITGEPDTYIWHLELEFLRECVVLLVTDEHHEGSDADAKIATIRAFLKDVGLLHCTSDGPGPIDKGKDKELETPARFKRDASPRPPFMGLISGVLGRDKERDGSPPTSGSPAAPGRSPAVSALPSPARGMLGSASGAAAALLGGLSAPNSPSVTSSPRVDSNASGVMSPFSTGSVTASPVGDVMPKSGGLMSTPSLPHVETCKPTAAILTLIALFTSLAFAPPQLLHSQSRNARGPASSHSILIFRDILELISSPTCQRARLAGLQWLLRLRADRSHRLYVKKDIEEEVTGFAALVGRTEESRRAMEAAVNDAILLVPVPEASQGTGGPEESDMGRKVSVRGRQEKGSRSVSKERGSRSRSRQPQQDRRLLEQQLPPLSPPIWAVPEELPFAVDVGTRPSEGMTTYEAPSPDGSASQVTAEYWLPVSAYLAHLVDLLRGERDWELVSYVLVHLPVQLANKHLFCGPKVRAVIPDLVNMVCKDVIGDGMAKRIRLPDTIKPTDVHGLAYNTLAVLISYHQGLERQEQDMIVDMLQEGLTRDSATAKPCLQALAIAAFELPLPMNRALSKILPKLTQIMSASSMSVHIIELLCVIGSIPELYANFTKEDYQRVFGVAVQYVQYHNDAKTVDAGSSYSLTQHILGLAYYSIYVWFLAIPLAERAQHVPYIARSLQLASQNKGVVDEQTEVCFDWLARYTYANADPRPHRSFLADIIMEPSTEPDSVISEKFYIQGHSLIYLRTLEKRGWAEIVSHRPSGTTQVLCKLENVPTTGPTEFSPDPRTHQALLMADRDEELLSAPVLPAPAILGSQEEQSQALSPSSEQQSRQVFAFPPQGGVRSLDPLSGYVWAGFQPSQRRKTVSVLPSFFSVVIGPFPGVTTPPSGFSPVPDSDQLRRTLRLLEAAPVIDTHSIGILYVAPGQSTEVEILGNQHGSPAYTRFLHGLGRLIKLEGQKDVYHGGLDIEANMDGQYAYAWWDDIAQILYHTATLMPNWPHDDGYTIKKRHIGNDHVRIVWNESGAPYKFDTLATEFQFVNVVIEPHSAGILGAYSDSSHEHDFFKVLLQRDPRMPEFGPIGMFKIVSAKHLAVVVRQMSLLADFFAKVYRFTRRDTIREEYVTNWRYRLGILKRLGASLPTLRQADPGAAPSAEMDFTSAY